MPLTLQAGSRRDLAANARPFRYGFYPVIAAGFLLFAAPAAWQAGAVGLWCVLWPPIADIATRGGGRQRSLHLHLAEVVLVCLLFAVAGVPMSLLAAACIVLIMSNALQGGLLQAFKASALGASALACGFAIAPPAMLPPAMPVFSGLFLLAYCVLIAHVAFKRVLVTHGERAETRALNERLQQYLPHTLAQRLRAAGRPRLERRWLVVVFADLAGFTGLVERLQTEELAALLDGYLRCIASVTHRWRGSVSKVVGDGAFLVFGEEEATRSRQELVADALGCCRQLAEELGRLTEAWRGGGLPGAARVKTGIASGYCSLGDWGGGGRLEYTVIGHPVNLASRLQDLALPGEVLLCERTALLARVPLSPVLSHGLKGLGEVAFRKLRRPAASRPAP